jgi:hypothetical protein
LGKEAEQKQREQKEQKRQQKRVQRGERGGSPAWTLLYARREPRTQEFARRLRD